MVIMRVYNQRNEDNKINKDLLYGEADHLIKVYNVILILNDIFCRWFLLHPGEQSAPSYTEVL